MNVYQGNGSHIVRDASFPCTYEGCLYTTNNRNNWRVHRHMHKIRQTRQYGCEECNFTATHAEQGILHSIRYCKTLMYFHL